MRILDKVEIYYFRSVYSASLRSLCDLNVFIGKNDAGKSNILKALNLFFNNDADFESDFEFLRDLSRIREEEARSAKGRATIWVRVTFNNFLKWSSLPEKFSIKRSWNRYDGRPTDSYPKNVPATTIGRYLSGLSFHYVPAVRGRDIFSHYLELLHDSLMDDEKAGLKESASELLDRINDSTTDMSDRIRIGLGFDSKVQVPENLRELFQALDFATKFGTHDIPLQLRGDGIQARHIPFILDFIARHSRKSHIWAYEEPENSLEMTRAFELAEQFQSDFSKQNQIFLTTHSPAFYDLGGSDVSRWYVQSDKSGPGGQDVTTVSEIRDTDIADAELGMAAVVTERSREIFERVTSLESDIQAFSERLALAELPQVVTEGPSDKIILDACTDKLCDEAFCEFVASEGASNVSAYIKTVARMQALGRPAIAGIFDNDAAGRAEVKRCSSFHRDNRTHFRTINRTRQVYAGLLPVPDCLEPVLAELGKHVEGDLFCPISIEFMFPPKTIADAVEAGVLELKTWMLPARDGELALRMNATAQLGHLVDPEFLYVLQIVEQSSKMKFANWVASRPADDYRYFAPFISELKDILAVRQD